MQNGCGRGGKKNSGRQRKEKKKKSRMIKNVTKAQGPGPTWKNTQARTLRGGEQSEIQPISTRGSRRGGGIRRLKGNHSEKKKRQRTEGATRTVSRVGEYEKGETGSSIQEKRSQGRVGAKFALKIQKTKPHSKRRLSPGRLKGKMQKQGSADTHR